MIMKDEIDDLYRIINDYVTYFDKIYITVTDKKTYTALKDYYANKLKTSDLIEVSYFEWIDHFGQARIYNQQQVRTDYWMWIDLDDEIEGVEKIPQVITYMDTQNIDAIWLKYNYVRRLSLLDAESIFWRERIIRTASNLQWKNEAIHEFVHLEEKVKHELLPDVVVTHRKTAEQLKASVRRNQRILQNEWRKKHSVTTAYYLGATLRELGDYESAIEKFSFVVEHDSNEGRKFTALVHLFECNFQIGLYDAAIAATDESVVIDPDHPGPWYQKFVAYRAMGRHEMAMQFAETAMDKGVNLEKAIQMDQDTSWYQYKGPFAIAQAYLEIGNIERAYQLYKMVKSTAPNYIEELSMNEGKRWDDIFEHAHVKTQAND